MNNKSFANKTDPGVSVIIPAYNEEEKVGEVLDCVKNAMDSSGHAYEIIAVDDASADNTVKVIRSKPYAMLIRNTLNKGYGASLKAGIRQSRYDIIVIIDADGTYPGEKIPDLLRHMKDHDMVVAARTGQDVYMPVFRKIAKVILTTLANYLSGEKIPDLNSGLRAIKKEAVMDFLNILCPGFSFTTTVTLALLTNDYSVKYVPINYHHRKQKSKFRPVKDTINMLTLIFRVVLYFNPLRIFVPLSLAMIFSGVLVFTLSLLFLPKILDTTSSLLIVTGIQTMVVGLLADLIDKRMK